MRQSYPTFPANLRKYMEKKHLSQSKLGRMTGMSNSTIFQYLRGERSPTEMVLGHLADALGLTIEDLIATEGMYYGTVGEAITKWQKIKIGMTANFVYCGNNCTLDTLRNIDKEYKESARKRIFIAVRWLDGIEEKKERMIRGRLERRGEYTREQAEEWFYKKYAAMEEQIRLYSKYLADYKPIEDRTVFQHYHSIAPWTKGYEIVICEGEELGKWSDVGEKATEY